MVHERRKTQQKNNIHKYKKLQRYKHGSRPVNSPDKKQYNLFTYILVKVVRSAFPHLSQFPMFLGYKFCSLQLPNQDSLQ